MTCMFTYVGYFLRVQIFISLLKQCLALPLNNNLDIDVCQKNLTTELTSYIVVKGKHSGAAGSVLVCGYY